MKTILILHHVSSLGGGTKSMFDVALMLKEHFRVVVCIPNGSADICRVAESYGIEHYEVKTPIPSFNVYSGMPSFFSRYFLSRLFRFSKSKKLVNELLEFEPEAIVFNTSVTALLAKHLPSNVKKICIIRETFIKSPLNYIIKTNFENNFNGVAYISEHEKNYLNIKRPIQEIIPDCLNIEIDNDDCLEDLRKQYLIKESDFCILFMGGLIQIKGLDVLLKATKRLGDDYKVVVAGNIDESVFKKRYIIKHFYQFSYIRYLMVVKRYFYKMIKQGKVIVTGYVDNIAPFMRTCDTVVFPSTSAHQPRPCIEAGYYNKSCIISDYEATREFFLDGYNAMTFKPRRANCLSEKLKYLHDHPDENKRIGYNNYRMSVEKHDYEKIQIKLKKFFDEILND